MQGGIGDILHQEEIKELISKICLIKIEDFVSPFWFKQDQSLQKLNMQLHASAIMKNDEFILEELIFADKLTGMIYDLIATSVWKKKIWPLMKTDYS